jgi:hypothetical protein
MVETEDPGKAVEIPEYNKKNWAAFGDQLPKFLLPWGYKDTLETIARCWRDSHEIIDANLATTSSVLALPHVPDLERKDAAEYLNSTQVLWGSFAGKVTAIVQKTNFPWKEIKALAADAKTLTDGISEDDQAIALLRAISKRYEEFKDPRELRRKIAQHAFDEIFNTGDYHIYDYTGSDDGEVASRTTQDTEPVEENELEAAIRSPLWNEETLGENRKMYLAWRRAALSDENDVDPRVATQLTNLWNGIRGKGTENHSSLYYLQLAEDIYRGLEEGGAFDIDLNEYMEEGDDEEEAEEE